MKLRNGLRLAWAWIRDRAVTFELNFRRKAWWLGIALLLLTGAFALWIGPLSTPDSATDAAASCPSAPSIIDLEFAGTHERAELLYKCWDTGTLDRIPDGLTLDVAFIAVYVIALAWGCLDGAYRFRSAASKTTARALAGLVVLAGALDLVENLALWANHAERGESGTWTALALGATLPKWTIVVVATPVAIVGAVHAWTRRKQHAGIPPRPVWPDTLVTQWERNFVVGDTKSPVGERVGICCSGGGIRSASFNLGVLQVLREKQRPNARGETLLHEAEHMTAVSGGSYLAGAWQLLAHANRDDPAVIDTVFEPGSREEDHVRRHGRYLADTLFEWLLAGARFVAGFVLNIAVIVAILYVVARPIGWVQRNLLFRNLVRTGAPHLTAGHWIAIGATAGAAFLIVVLVICAQPFTDGSVARSASRFAWAAAATLAALALVMLLVLGTGYVARGTELALDAVTNQEERKETGLEEAQTPTAAIVWLGTTGVLSVLTFKPMSERRVEKRAKKLDKIPAQIGRWRPWVEKLAPRLLTLVLALGALVVFALFVDGAAGRGAGGRGRFLWWDSLADSVGVGIVLGALLLLWWLTDQTSWSLHPLYKRRLSTAFAIARTDDGTSEYPYEQPTTLSTVLAPAPGFPQLTICACANVSSGAEAGAGAGRKAMSFTFDADRVGNPRLGYVPTTTYENRLDWRFQADSTTLASMAVSGAAFASANGRASFRWVGRLLAIANARLGVWLPSPRFVEWYDGDGGDGGTGAPIPVKRRGLGYLLREIFSVNNPDDALLYISDGGHWDNMGLVELLRRRCNYVVCIDGSGDNPATLGTLSEAIDLAHEELGVRVTFPAGALDQLKPGSAGVDEGDPLAKRTSARGWAVGDLRFPDSIGVADGKILFIKALVVAGMPEELRRHALGQARFPNDPTTDQWFSADQFNAYVALGRLLAEDATLP